MVRQFTLINSNGDVWNLMSKSSFFHAPGGLGFTKSIETEIAGFEFIELRDDLDQKVVSGEMVFADYSVYGDFAKFISHEPLKLGYKPYSTTWYYLDIKVSSLQKTEIDRTTGLLLCPVDFLAFTTWYTIDKYENVVPVPPPVVNLMVQGLSATIEEDWKIVANSDDDFVYRALVGTVTPDTNTVPVQLPGFTGDVYDLTAGDYYFKAIGKRQNVKSYFQTLPFEDEAEGNPVEIARAVEVAPNSLEVSVSPTQDGTPWISSSVDTDPYTFRAMPSGASGANREYDKIVGGSVVWNQLFDSINNSARGIIITKYGARFTTSGSAGSTGNVIVGHSMNTSVGHKCLVLTTYKGTSVNFRLYNTGESTPFLAQLFGTGTVFSATGTSIDAYMYVASGTSYDDSEYTFNLFDLNTMFGSTIADYVYSLEQNTAGSGIAWLKSYGFFTKPYHAHTLPTIQSVSVSEKVTTGKNLFDEGKLALASGWSIDSNGFYYGNSSDLNALYGASSDGFISNFEPNTQYTFTAISKVATSSAYMNFRVVYTDGTTSAIVLSNSTTATNISVTTDSGKTIEKIVVGYISGYGTVYLKNVQVEKGTTATTYESYTANTYALSTTELRGIPSLVDGKLVYDGDEYSSSGTVTRKYGVVDLGTLNYNANNDRFYTTGLASLIKQSAFANAMVVGFIKGNTTADEKTFQVAASGYVYFRDTQYTTAAAFKTAMSGVYMLYELATPTTESADPFTNPQVIDEHGTESYTDYPMSQGTRDVAIPVGHKSNYALSVPVVGTDEVSVNVSGKNLCPDVLYQASTNVVVLGQDNNSTRDISLMAGTYTISYGASGVLGTIYYDIGGGSISLGNMQSSTFTLASDSTARFWLYYGGGVSKDDITYVQLELGSTPTAYVPFVGNTTYTHSLSPTMYGGSVEMVGGTETTEMAEYTIQATDTFALALTDSGKDFWRLQTTLSPTAKENGDMWCDYFNHINPMTDTPQIGDAYLNASGKALFVLTANAFDSTSIKDLLVGLGCKITYELATPTTSQGAVSAVSLLKGDNVLSTDGNELAVNFKAYPDDGLVLDKFGELASDPDSAVDSQAVSNFTVYDPARVQFYMDYEGLPYDYDVKAELVSGSYSNEKIYSYPYPYTYGAGVNGEIHVTNDGTVPAYCKLTIVGEVEDPTWSVYQNGNLIERGRVTATIVSGHKLVMNSQPRALELSEYSIDGTFIANLYGVSDFSTKRFITIPVGESTITVTHTGETPFDMYLEVYPLAKTI